MTIAVNTRINKETQPEGYEDFIFELLDQVVTKFPQHQFIYIFDAPYKNMVFQKNVTPVISGPKGSSSLRLQYWFNYRIPAILRKHNAGVFVSLEGICSLRTKVPQCLLLSDLSFLNYPALLKKSQARFYTKFTPAFLAKARSIATVSTLSKNIIADHYKIAAEDIGVIHPSVSAVFKPLDWEEQEIIKEKYTEGKAYFLCNTNSNLINLLKAFTFFKKRQKSNMLLLIAGNIDETFKKELKTYKLRNEVKLLEGLDKAELAKITAAAYAMVYPFLYDELALPVLQSMQCNVPVVISDAGALPVVFGEAVLYFNPENYEDIAQKMMLVYKDEAKANELVKAGKELLLQHQPGKNAELLMECILKAANN
ncbi:MAG: glycosyltransferase family 4 protein [Chitinophagaceae bacterium]|nr:glycosyltransferase family 4 protein [Chitinophagaceae bacterium]